MKTKATLEDFEREVKNAQKFLKKHQDDVKLIQFLKYVKASKQINSQKWSMIFDYLYDNYKDECMNSTITTGLFYLVE
jgi:hypothetical protein